MALRAIDYSQPDIYSGTAYDRSRIRKVISHEKSKDTRLVPSSKALLGRGADSMEAGPSPKPTSGAASLTFREKLIRRNLRKRSVDVEKGAKIH